MATGGSRNSIGPGSLRERTLGPSERPQGWRRTEAAVCNPRREASALVSGVHSPGLRNTDFCCLTRPAKLTAGCERRSGKCTREPGKHRRFCHVDASLSGPSPFIETTHQDILHGPAVVSMETRTSVFMFVVLAVFSQKIFGNGITFLMTS